MPFYLTLLIIKYISDLHCEPEITFVRNVLLNKTLPNIILFRLNERLVRNTKMLSEGQNLTK